MCFLLEVTEVLPCGASVDRLQVPDPKARVAEEGQARTDYLTKETFTVDPEQGSVFKLPCQPEHYKTLLTILLLALDGNI